MIDLQPHHLADAVALCEPLFLRAVAFDMPIFDVLKRFQRKLENRIRRDIGNAEVIKCLSHTHPEAQWVSQ